MIHSKETTGRHLSPLLPAEFKKAV